MGDLAPTSSAVSRCPLRARRRDERIAADLFRPAAAPGGDAQDKGIVNKPHYQQPELVSFLISIPL